MKVDLFVNGELLDPADDKKLVSQLPLRDKMVYILIDYEYVCIFLIFYNYTVICTIKRLIPPAFIM